MPVPTCAPLWPPTASKPQSSRTGSLQCLCSRNHPPGPFLALPPFTLRIAAPESPAYCPVQSHSDFIKVSAGRPPVVIQTVNELPQPAIIAFISYGWIFRVTAQHSFPPGGAQGSSPDVQQGQAANAAVGGKQYGEETLAGTPNAIFGVIRRNLAGNNRTPGYCSGGLTSPDSVLATAEDSLLEPPRRKL